VKAFGPYGGATSRPVTSPSSSICDDRRGIGWLLAARGGGSDEAVSLAIVVISFSLWRKCWSRDRSAAPEREGRAFRWCAVGFGLAGFTSLVSHAGAPVQIYVMPQY